MKSKNIILVMVVSLPILFASSASSATSTNTAQIILSWEFATTNMNGTPLTDLGGAKIYYGTQSGGYTEIIDAGMGGASGPGGTGQYTVTGLVHGAWYYFSGVAYSTSGLESGLCEEVSRMAKDVVPCPPAPLNLRIVKEQVCP